MRRGAQLCAHLAARQRCGAWYWNHLYALMYGSDEVLAHVLSSVLHGLSIVLCCLMHIGGGDAGRSPGRPGAATNPNASVSICLECIF